MAATRSDRKRKNLRRGKGLDALGQALTLNVTTCQKVEAAGIEPEDHNSQIHAGVRLTESVLNLSALCLQRDGTACRPLASLDNQLARIIKLWPSLQAETRKLIDAICFDARTPEERLIT